MKKSRFTSSWVVSPVHRSRLQGEEEKRRMTAISGMKCFALSQKSSPIGWLERMLLASSIWHSTRSYLIWRAKTTKHEILGLRWKDCDLKQRIICVRQALTQTKQGLQFEDVKPKAPDVPLPSPKKSSKPYKNRNGSKLKTKRILEQDMRNMGWSSVQGKAHPTPHAISLGTFIE